MSAATCSYFFFSRLLKISSEVRQRLEPMFKERVQERFGVEADSLSLAARILAAVAVDMVDRRDVDTLLSMQCIDGSWGNSWFIKTPKTAILIGNDGVTTALAVRAIQQVESKLKTHNNPSRLASCHWHSLPVVISICSLLWICLWVQIWAPKPPSYLLL